MNRTVSIYRLLLTCSIATSLAFGSLSAKNSIGNPGPIDPDKPLDPLTCLNIGDTAAISLMQYHSYAAPESKSSKEISIKDTCVVHFDFKKFSITGNREVEATTNNIAASVVVKKSNNGIFEDYQKFKLRLNANPDGTYTIANAHRHNSFLAYPCLYKVVYEGIVDDKDHWIGDDKDISIDPIPSDSIFITPIIPANSESLPAHSSIYISAKCNEADPDILIHQAPSPEIIESVYSSGSAMGAYGVSSTGAATYSMTVEAPRHKFNPNIGISYNSQLNGYGLVGYGTNITGISSITRTGKNLFYDNDYQGITYTDSDNYLLNGKRLIPTGAVYDNEVVYSVEGNPYPVVVRYGNGSTAWFAVLDSNGEYYEYGNSESSKNVIDGQYISEWFVRYAKDPNGNYALYEYEKSNLTVYPKIIYYGMHDAVTINETSSILFEYQDLGSNARPFVIKGRQGSVDKCLKSITTATLGSTYRKYIFDYDSTSDQSSVKYNRLTSINIQNGDGESLSPVRLNWNHLPKTDLKANKLRDEIENTDPFATENNVTFLSSDLNSDGISDIIKIAFASGNKYGNTYVATYVYVSLSEKNDNGTISYGTPVRYLIPSAVEIRNFCSSSFNTPAIVDIDGDGYNDLVFSYNSGSGSKFTKLFCIIYGKDIANKHTPELTTIEVPLKSHNDESLFSIFDIDGDGKEEILYLDLTNNNGYYSGGIVEHNKLLQSKTDLFQFKLPKKPKSLFTGDYNNDGLIDLIFFYDGGYTIYYNNGGTGISLSFSESNHFSANEIGYKIYMSQGDFDGDGLIDFVYVNRSKLRIAHNNGNGTFTIVTCPDLTFVELENDPDHPRYNIIVCDINHDGCSDVVLTNTKSKHSFTDAQGNEQIIHLEKCINWLYSDGTNLRLFAKNSKCDFKPKFNNHIFSGDFDGDGLFEVANYGGRIDPKADGNKDSYFYVYRTSYRGYDEGRVNSISDGNGNNVRFNYSALSNTRVYKGTEKSQYPLMTYSFPISVVSTSYSTESIKYNYKNLKYHTAGRGSLGFSLVEKENLTTGIKQITEITKWDESHYVPLETVSRTIVGTDTATTVVTNNIVNLKNNYFCYPYKETSTDLDGNKTVTEYTYDTDRGILCTTKTTYDDSDMYTMTHNFGYTYTGRRFVPMFIDIEQKHSDDPDFHRKRSLLLYDDNGNVTQRTDNYGSDMELVTTFTYDHTGNVLSKAVSGKGVTTVTKHFEYDSSARFVTRTYSLPASAEIVSTYDCWGNLLTQTDATVPDNKLTRRLTYDGWGRKLTETAPDGTGTTYEYGHGATSEHHTYCKTVSSNGAEAIRWFDNLGRERLAKTTGIGGVDIATTTRYNAKGQADYVESFNGILRLTTSHTYDRRGRVLTTTTSRGSSTSYTYGNRMVVTEKDGRTYTSHNDAWGNIVSTIDPASSVEYKYSSTGRPSSITTDGSTVTMEYDTAGNRTCLSDPDAGTNTYTYAADGTLLSHTDGRGITTEYTFDNLGRTVKIKTGSHVVTNTYGTEGYSAQRLTRRASGGNFIDYTYDRYGRVTKESRNIAGKGVFAYEFEYNSKGQLAGTVYPGGLKVTYGYDKNGNRTTIHADGQQVWQFSDNDGRTSHGIALGSLQRTHKLNHHGYTTFIGMRKIRLPGQAYADSIRLNYDATTGNLLSRQINNQAERRYAYDSMDRLLSVSDNDQQLLEMEYDSNGNILSKSDVGDYGYGSSRPHAVTQIDNATEAIPSAAQTVEFDDIGKVSLIQENGLSMAFTYGPDSERWHSVLTHDGSVEREAVYAGSYERITENGSTNEFYYLDNGLLVVRRDGGAFVPYAMFADQQGSILSVVAADGSRVFAAAYDEWGQQRVTLNAIGFSRGYTAHEMMPQFGIINMNGRLYDPLLARFFSPDNYVQQPTNSQNFNRYSYCLNNPLKYTDPSGELFGLDDLLVFGIGSALGYVSNGITTGSWGLKSVKTGLMSGISAWLGFNGIGVGGNKQLAGTYIKDLAIKTIAASALPSLNTPMDGTMGAAISPTIGMGEHGLAIGLNASLCLDFGGGWRTDMSFGATNQYSGWYARMAFRGLKIGYGETYYREQYIVSYKELPSGETIKTSYLLGEQTVGTITAQVDGWQLRVSNDCIGDGHDRWRTSAVEITKGNLALGTSVTTNNGKEASETANKEYPRYSIENGIISNYIKNESPHEGIWKKGVAYSAPLWIGFKNGNQIYRFGYSHIQVQDKTQNFVHENIAATPLFKNYKYFQQGIFIYSGTNSPISIW
ncbi:polymorphic toxin type 23 domain-containing protein [uncultured Muribaculum sp.]|uniref:polymorphic toxin type 23 domain-containing protein n=1 Tax=uncultured Muribaculum sp. TaxID=1918613 RepID=UPI00266F0FE8|nr:polymorphic toxin type 23 domain-containing protein [uncultured Muribaculum sp.]